MPKQLSVGLYYLCTFILSWILFLGFLLGEKVSEVSKDTEDTAHLCICILSWIHFKSIFPNPVLREMWAFITVRPENSVEAGNRFFYRARPDEID